MLVKEAEALGSHAALVTAQIEGTLQVVNVEDDLIVSDGERINVVEIGKKKPNFRSVVANGTIGISASGKRSRKFDKAKPGLKYLAQQILHCFFIHNV